MSLYQNILDASHRNSKLLAILLDPEKLTLRNIDVLAEKIKKSPATHVFFGGSTYDGNDFEELIAALKKHLDLPIFLFPGDFNQISDKADALLFLSLLSGRNPEYLIGQQIKVVPILENKNLEIIPTAYLLIENGKQTAVEIVSETKPIKRENVSEISQTAKAGEYLGMQLIYLEAGSGAKHPIPENIISETKAKLNIPLIVGGGIRSKEAIKNAYKAGADMVVIGTAFENDNTFFD